MRCRRRRISTTECRFIGIQCPQIDLHYPIFFLIFIFELKYIFSWVAFRHPRENRTSLYNKIAEEFYVNLQQYFTDNENTELPSVTYFVEKANLSANYFGDLIKHCTNMSPIEHIHNFILEQAKYELRNTSLSISEISHKLGVTYPNYFARFFKKQIGMSPKEFRVKV